MYFEFIVE